MTTLEKTLLDVAKRHLQELQTNTSAPKTEVELYEAAMGWQRLTTLTEFAHLQDSGLSPLGLEALMGIEREAIAAMNTLRALSEAASRKEKSPKKR